MKLIIKRTLTTEFRDRLTGATYKIKTKRADIEPNFIFEKRHRLKVQTKKRLLKITDRFKHKRGT